MLPLEAIGMLGFLYIFLTIGLLKNLRKTCHGLEPRRTLQRNSATRQVPRAVKTT